MIEPRAIPSIDALLQRPRVQTLVQEHGRAAAIDALRRAAAAVRTELAAPARVGRFDSAEAAIDAIEAAAAGALARELTGSLRPVVNATGVIVHTNLGRAPLASSAIERIARVAAGYSNLEYDLERGARGARDVHAERLVCAITGAGAAVVVNNNAAATLLVLAALAAGREVIISRGELIEIGGGFRVPDVMAQSGASLREVGTTNRTRVADYAAAIAERTALLLRVHPSNFRIEGFTERPSLPELAALAHRFGLPLVEDLGSGNPTNAYAADLGEPSVAASLREGADVVFFSGDKMLGGPQAGIVAGRVDLLQRIRKHPLMRALRVDKLTYAALEATLLEHLRARATDTVPVPRFLSLAVEAIDARARALVSSLAGIAGLDASIMDGFSTVGGGCAPGATLPTRLIALDCKGTSANALDVALRRADPPVVARIEHDRVVLDLRTVLEEQDEVLARVLRHVGEAEAAAPRRAPR
jgi:L-seryl-tRNA(Ser) seleniumtransferase